MLLKLGQVEGGEFGPPQRRGEADQHDRSVSPANQGVGDVLKHGADRLAVAGAFWTGATPMRRRIPRITAARLRRTLDCPGP